VNIVFGKNGQVASCLRDFLLQDGSHNQWHFVDSKECNFSKPQNVYEFLSNLSFVPKIIINTSAYTAVDLAESEQDLAMNINAYAVGKIAQYCKENNTMLFQYSTDYVFNGDGSNPFAPTDTAIPINYYGISKLAGERLIVQSGCNYYIMRTSWVYSQYGKNFVKTMLNLSQKKEEISIVCDQIGSPTNANDIAKMTITMLNKNFNFGIYHFTGDGFCSWYDFACEIIKNTSQFMLVKTQIILPILTAQFPTPAIRPLNSRLNNGTLQEFSTPWLISLEKVMKQLIFDNENNS
jgi:dTDP-4-dehydrorhamnose reductase